MFVRKKILIVDNFFWAACSNLHFSLLVMGTLHTFNWSQTTQTRNNHYFLFRDILISSLPHCSKQIETVHVHQGILIVRIDTQTQQKLIMACQRFHFQKSQFHPTRQCSHRNLTKQIDQQRRKLLPLNILNFINICVELHNSFLTKKSCLHVES